MVSEAHCPVAEILITLAIRPFHCWYTCCMQTFTQWLWYSRNSHCSISDADSRQSMRDCFKVLQFRLHNIDLLLTDTRSIYSYSNSNKPLQSRDFNKRLRSWCDSGNKTHLPILHYQEQHFIYSTSRINIESYYIIALITLPETAPTNINGFKSKKFVESLVMVKTLWCL